MEDSGQSFFSLVMDEDRITTRRRGCLAALAGPGGFAASGVPAAGRNPRRQRRNSGPEGWPRAGLPRPPPGPRGEKTEGLSDGGREAVGTMTRNARHRGDAGKTRFLITIH